MRISKDSSAEELRSFYESQYENLAMDEARIDRKIERLSAVAPSGSFSGLRVVEIGCGEGRLLESMGKIWEAGDTAGVDLSSVPLVTQKARHPEAKLAQSDACRLPFGDRSIDALYFADLLEHVPSPESMLEEVRRVATQLVCLVPLESGLISDVHYRYRRMMGKRTNLEAYGHLHRFTARRARRLLRGAGFRIDELRIFETPPTAAASIPGRLYQAPQRLMLRWPAAYRALYGASALVAWCR